MSVHDETWDKCPHCKQVIKSWHGIYHDSKACLTFLSHEEYEKFQVKSSKDRNPDYGFPDPPIPESLPAFYGCDIANPKYRSLVNTTEYIPEMMSFERDFVLCDLKLTIEAGLEYAQEYLSRHDQELGRTTRKNESWAETIEKDIAEMKQVLARIEQYENP